MGLEEPACLSLFEPAPVGENAGCSQREIIKESRLDTTYGESDESLYHRKERTLHRLTTHSLRHYAITKFAKSTNGNVVLASRFARHANPNTTMRYIAKDSEQLYKEIDFAFSDKLEPAKELAKSVKVL